MHNRKIGMTGIADGVGIEAGRILESSSAENPSLTGVSDEERHQLISEAAYYRAEQRSFEPGHELEDWLTAEAEIEMRLSTFGIEDLLKHS